MTSYEIASGAPFFRFGLFAMIVGLTACPGRLSPPDVAAHIDGAIPDATSVDAAIDVGFEAAVDPLIEQTVVFEGGDGGYPAQLPT